MARRTRTAAPAIAGLTMVELEVMAANAVNRFLVLGSEWIREHGQDQHLTLLLVP